MGTTTTIPVQEDDLRGMIKLDPATLGIEKYREEQTVEAPATGTAQDRLRGQGVDEAMTDALKECKRIYKAANAQKRQEWIRRVQVCFAQMKNDSRVLYQANASPVSDTLNEIAASIGVRSDQPDDLYQHNDNVYQMLGLTLIAALSVTSPKTRYQPNDPENEEDITIAQQASVIAAFNERRNNNEALQRKELLFLWCSGSYFAYTRDIVDSNRAGVVKQPQMALQPTEVFPARYECSNCGASTPDSNEPDPSCQGCNAPLGGADWHEPETAPVPVRVGDKQMPDHMTAIDVYSGLNVDASFDAMELYESPYLDLEGEVDIGSIRSAYPDAYKDIQPGQGGDASATTDQTAALARQSLTSPGRASSTNEQTQGTYSRCWLQPEAFSILEDQNMAKRLLEKFPDGVKLVSFGDTVLDAAPEKMTEKWSWCPTIKGFGLYPFGIGDAGLDIQRRINDAANSVHAYLDRLAFGTILADADYIDVDALQTKQFTPGNLTPIFRDDEAGLNKPLDQMLFQPQFHIDSKIYEYGPQLIQLMQVICGVQPQTFGGSDPNVKTMGGQEQALKTAMGRMKLFIDQIREERAIRARNSVRCTVANMDAKMKIALGGETPGTWQVVTVLRNELTGDFLAYPETDQGFPASYEEIQERIMQLFQFAKGNDFLMGVLDDPDMQKTISRYILPEQLQLPGDAERTRLKEIVTQLSQSQPVMIQDPATGQQVPGPSIMPNHDIDDMQMGVVIAKTWLQKNWQQPGDGFTNVLLFLKVCAQFAEQAQAAQAIQQQQAQPQGQQGGKPGG